MFDYASKFNGDISLWNVANVNNMQHSKSTCKMTRRDVNSCYCVIGGFCRGLGFGGGDVMWWC